LTIFIQGGFTEKLIKYLGIKTNVDPELYIYEMEKRENNKNVMDFQRRVLYPLVVKRGYKSSQTVFSNDDGTMDNSSGGGILIYYYYYYVYFYLFITTMFIFIYYYYYYY
jgi:hypothetical protein